MPDYQDNSSPPPPPSGDAEKAEKYIRQLVNLIDDERISIQHTDLTQFDPSNLQDHYRLDLTDYSIEVSHSKQPNSGADSFIMLFTNVQQVQAEQTQKIILAYMHLSLNQFQRFAGAAHNQLQRIKRREEDKRLVEVLQPIDELLRSMDPATPTQINDKKFQLEPEQKNEDHFEEKTLSDYSSTEDLPDHTTLTTSKIAVA